MTAEKQAESLGPDVPRWVKNLATSAIKDRAARDYAQLRCVGTTLDINAPEACKALGFGIARRIYWTEWDRLSDDNWLSDDDQWAEEEAE